MNRVPAADKWRSTDDEVAFKEGSIRANWLMEIVFDFRSIILDEEVVESLAFHMDTVRPYLNRV